MQDVHRIRLRTRLELFNGKTLHLIERVVPHRLNYCGHIRMRCAVDHRHLVPFVDNPDHNIPAIVRQSVFALHLGKPYAVMEMACLCGLSIEPHPFGIIVAADRQIFLKNHLIPFQNLQMCLSALEPAGLHQYLDREIIVQMHTAVTSYLGDSQVANLRRIPQCDSIYGIFQTSGRMERILALRTDAIAQANNRPDIPVQIALFHLGEET